VLRGMTDLSVKFMQRFMPDPFLFAVLLTAIVMVVGGFAVEGATFKGLADTWFTGVWGGGIFTFALEMILILVTGHTLAEAPVIKKGLSTLASKPKNQTQAAILIFVVAGVAALLNWGLGLVIGTLLAKEVAKKLKNVHFGFLVAAGYMGFITCNTGFSGSIALLDTAKDPVTNIIFKNTHQIVPLSDTLFQPYNWIPTILLLIVIPFVLKFIAPKTTTEIDPEALQDAPEPRREGTPTFASRLENAWIINVLLALVALYVFFFIKEAEINITTVIMLFTVFGLLLHGTPIRFIRAFNNAAKASGPLVLQYPLYGGLMALMNYAPDHHQSLAVMLATGLVKGTTETMLPFMNYIGSLIITLFVPSAGGHWTVQGPIAIQAAQHFSTSTAYLGKVSMSVAMGESVSNMLQPFWVLPVLSIARLSIRDVMGFTVIAFVVGFVIFGVSLFIPAI
jgi:short-chain fatty acids transporter